MTKSHPIPINQEKDGKETQLIISYPSELAGVNVSVKSERT